MSKHTKYQLLFFYAFLLTYFLGGFSLAVGSLYSVGLVHIPRRLWTSDLQVPEGQPAYCSGPPGEVSATWSHAAITEYFLLKQLYIHIMLFWHLRCLTTSSRPSRHITLLFCLCAGFLEREYSASALCVCVIVVCYLETLVLKYFRMCVYACVLCPYCLPYTMVSQHLFLHVYRTGCVLVCEVHLTFVTFKSC